VVVTFHRFPKFLTTYYRLADFGLAIEVQGDQEAWFGELEWNILVSFGLKRNVPRFRRHPGLPVARGAEKGAVRPGRGRLGVRRHPLHPPGRLPALLGRGPAPPLRSDQSRCIRRECAAAAGSSLMYLCGALSVPQPRVGHGDARRQEPYQQLAVRQPQEADHGRAGPQAPLGLRE